MKDSFPSAELKEVNLRGLRQKLMDARSGAEMRANLEQELGEPVAHQACLPPSIPDHDLVERIGTGAYGEVWLARNALGAFRAVKVVYRDRFDDYRPYEREFHGILKYEPISRTHEGLTAILHVGRNDKARCFYYVMELADNALGESGNDSATPGASANLSWPARYKPLTLRFVLSDRKRLPPAEAAELALKLGTALAHLHKHGLVHRDIKPSNVIFLNGGPKLADIGLITGAGDSHSVVGTEGYIPPEGPGGAQADVFSLGKLLYEISTGRDRLEFPQLPAGLLTLSEREAVLELNEIVTRACAPDRANRYGSATELMADLNLFLSGRSLREAHTMRRHLRWLRHSAVVGTTLLALATIFLLLARNAAVRARDAERESTERARIESGLRMRAQAAELEARRQLYSALLEQARTKVRTGELGQRVQALEAIRRAAAISNSAELRREAFAALALPDLAPARDLPLGPGCTLASMDPRMERFAVCSGTGPVEIRSSLDGQLLGTLPPSTDFPAYFARWSPDGRYLAVKRSRPAGKQAHLEVWDTRTSQPVILTDNAADGSAAFDPSKTEMMANLAGGDIAIWNLENGKETRRLALSDPAELLSIAPDAERFAASHHLADGWLVAVYRLSDGVRLSAHLFPERVTSLDWHPTGRWIAVADYGSSVTLFDSQSGTPQLLGRHKLEAVWTSFSPGGRYLFSGGWEREVICWDLWTMERALGIGMDGYVAQFSTDGRACAIVTRDCIHLFSFETPACRDFAEDLGGRLDRAVFSPDDQWLAARGQERLGVWHLPSNGAGALLKDHQGSRISFSWDSSKLIASRDDNCRAWALIAPATAPASPGLSLLRIEPPEGFTSFCLASNHAVLTCPLGSRMLSLDDLSAPATRWDPTVTGVNGCSQDGRYLAIFQPFTPWLHIYALPAFEPIKILTNRANIRDFEFSPDGARVSVSSSTGVAVWKTGDWQLERQITNCMGAVWSPRGTNVWIMKDYGNAALHSASTLEPLLPLPNGVLPLALSPDGNSLAVSVHSRRLQVWNLAELNQHFRALGIDW